MSMTTDSGKRMLGYLPRIYEESRVLQGLYDAVGAEVDGFWKAVGDVLDQAFVSTASWGLPLWEAELGFTSDPTMSDEDRRARINGRQRGYGTITISLVKRVAESYNNGRVSVIPDFPASSMLIRFVDTAGIPPNLADLQAELRRIIPATWAVTFEFLYMTWNDLDAKDITWNELDALNLTWDQFEVWATSGGTVLETLTLTGSEQ